MPAPTLAQIIAALLEADRFWSGPTVTYSIPESGSTWPGYAADDEQSYSTYQTLSASQANAFRAAIELWDELIALRLDETNDLSATGQIRIAFTDTDDFMDEDLAGFAYAPPANGGNGATWNGDIWLDYKSADRIYDSRYPHFTVLLHELGHALGLKHPFEDGETLPVEFDTTRYTVMSYEWNVDLVLKVFEPGPGGVGVTYQEYGVYFTTPMVFDIAAIQARYGADPATRAGNTVYTWTSGYPILQAVYDAGGIDTFDFSDHWLPQIIDLTPGAYSSMDYFDIVDQRAYWNALFPGNLALITEKLQGADTYTGRDNLGIAYGTVIENVVGGSAGDTLRGNAVANRIEGRAGADSIDGGDGQDYLRGDEGNDRITGGTAFDDINGNMGDDTAAGGPGSDWVVGGRDNDRLSGDEGDDIVYGNLGSDTGDGGEGADLIRGGQGDDSVAGGAGADWVSGDRDSDTMSGGAGADIFHTFGDAGMDRVIDFNRAEGDRVQLDPGTTYTVSQVGSDVVIAMGGGGQMILVGVSLSTLTGDWIFGA